MSIREVRLEAMLDTYSAGFTTNEDLLEAADRAQRKHARRTCLDTESRLDRYIKVIDFVEKLEPIIDTKPGSLQSMGIDYWIIFKDPNIPILPLQLKSSEGYVDDFKKNDKYAALHRAILVLNVGPQTSRSDFRELFIKEFKRVMDIVEKYPGVIRQLTNLYRTANN